MKIILLSGGSGKRLWPLSNDTRSKQFLKVLSDKEGHSESMVQRVYRQLNEAVRDVNVTIATSASQIDFIRKQLGPDVSVVVEPERRNTYPAILLACAHLLDVQKASEEEVAIVLPIDQYVDNAYFELLMSMEKAVLDTKADMVLMGIEPTYPSEKYGYIVTEDSSLKGTSAPQKVAHFVEKPTLEKSKELLAQKAYWNGGVFAFKLSYIKQFIVKELDGAISYQKLFDQYSSVKKDSFDYEVVEKCSSIVCVPYQGTWSDLGTWNTLTEQMRIPSTGYVLQDDTCENTHIINELSIPMVALGLKDLVVVANADGILVSDKETSSYMKPYIEQINNRPMYEERRWGEYKVLDYEQYSDQSKSLTKHLDIRAGKYISYQSHKLRDEIWTIVDGTGELLIDGHIRNVRRGDVAYITKEQKHSMRAVTDLKIIEVQIGTELIEEDIEKYDWEW